MSKPVAPASNIAFAFPDICLTTVGPSAVPIPYPNIAQLSDADNISDESDQELLVGGEHVLLETSVVSSSTGAEPANPNSGVQSGAQNGYCYMNQASGSVFYGPNKAGLVRFMDGTVQNASADQAPGNANGFIMSANPTVLVGD